METNRVINSTLVLTSRAKYYVDVRALLSADGAISSKPVGTRASELEWAFAGTSKTTPAVYEAGEMKKPAHTAWSHWIDSETVDEVNDEGDMYVQSDGTVLEKGVNADGSTYEELWQDLDVLITDENLGRQCIVLKAEEPSKATRGMLIRIGQWIQGISRVEDQISAVRWSWSVEEGLWKKTLSIGTGEARIPCEALFAASIEKGHLILARDQTRWSCIEAFSW